MNQTPISGIYLITNKRNNLKYVGQAKNIQKRIREHFSGCFNGKTLIDSAIAAEPKNFIWEIIEECAIEDLNYYEIYYIYYLDSMNHGYNRDFGGSVNYPHFYGEDHPRTYYSNEEMLEMRKKYVNCTIEELYNIYKRDQSFYTFKNQLLNSYINLPKYNKKEKRWIYPPSWKGEIIEAPRSTMSSNISEEEIMRVRRLSMTKTDEEIIHICGLSPFKSERHLHEAIVGKIYNWLPYYSKKENKWIYPNNWNGKKEQEFDATNWMEYFYRKERDHGKKLSNYQVLQIRYLSSIGYNSGQILEKLNLRSTCSKDAIKLLVNNKTYLYLPYLSSNKKEWIFPEILNQTQKDNFPKFIEILKKELKGDDA